MNAPSTRTILVLAVAALLLPGASATWYSYGTHEPDNALDDPTLMWTDPPQPGSSRIYFNVYTGTGPPVRGAAISPNVGLVKSANELYAMETHMAILGVWKDCNGDGYVGLAETAAREYPSDLLLDDSACPAITGPENAWTPGAHNYNGWVSELVPIGPPDTPAFVDDEYDLRVYRDPAAMIWGDRGRPDDDAAVSGSCPTAPQPRGTWQSTGGTLNYLDCLADRDSSGRLGLMETFNTPFKGRRLAGQNVPGLGDPLGLAFANDDNARGSRYDLPTFGTEDSSRTAVYVVDCNAEPTFHSGDFFNTTPLGPSIPSTLQNRVVPGLSPRAGDLTTATLPATLNRTQEDVLEDCDTSNDDGHDFYGNNYVFYVGETDFNAISAADKREADFNFQFQDWGRGGDVLGLDLGSPVYGGGAGMTAPYLAISNWNPGRTNTKGDTNRIVRTDLEEGTATLPEALYFTFYAHVGTFSTALKLDTPGGSGTYGSAQCGDNVSGIHKGWNCDKGRWYRNADGSAVPEPTPLARPGQAYQLRDVDCHDGRLGSTGVALGTAAYGTSPCSPR